eukprot:TRINITY_DN18290_c0_g1_i1.p1 TRINITY_DN18290_c0_g1~~TRINITY_DN18290_c0_g1_i1.p1  ORF type:complete len:866 (+),score=183.07 TRINITY_DN18290_c0_g1_i1:166-2763(+)
MVHFSNEAPNKNFRDTELGKGRADRDARFADTERPPADIGQLEAPRPDRLALLKRAKSEDNLAKHEQAVQQFRGFLVKKEGSTLRAWINLFDMDNDQSVSLHEFVEGMRALSYQGDVHSLYKRLDTDGSGQLAMEDVDPEQADIWRRFRIWCVLHFDRVEDVILVLNRLGTSTRGSAFHQGLKEDRPVTRETFNMGLGRAGWPSGHEDLLFDALDRNQTGVLELENWGWLDIELQRQDQKALAKEEARKYAVHLNQRKYQQGQMATEILQDFKRFLKRKYGSYVRAWRAGLSPNGSTQLQKVQFFKACNKIGWTSDVRILWYALDKDESGSISMDELDLPSAQMLVAFQIFVEDAFGSSDAAFRAIDKYKSKKVRQHEFEEALRHYGYKGPLKDLFFGFDKGNKKFIVEEDLKFIEAWKPLPYLTVKPNGRAMELVKNLLLQNYKTFLKAWRKVLDRGSRNRCNWDEFKSACKKMGFTGDIPGAWRAFDADLSGSICLQELDPASSAFLLSFRKWATNEFGSVKSAFGVFDSDASGEVTCAEFRRACRIYGFAGNTLLLFRALDTERSGKLAQAEVAFLDEWALESEPAIDEEDRKAEEDLRKSARTIRRTLCPQMAGVPDAASLARQLAAKATSGDAGYGAPLRRLSQTLQVDPAYAAARRACEEDALGLAERKTAEGSCPVGFMESEEDEDVASDSHAEAPSEDFDDEPKDTGASCWCNAATMEERLQAASKPSWPPLKCKLNSTPSIPSLVLAEDVYGVPPGSRRRVPGQSLRPAPDGAQLEPWPSLRPSMQGSIPSISPSTVPSRNGTAVSLRSITGSPRLPATSSAWAWQPKQPPTGGVFNFRLGCRFRSQRRCLSIPGQ